MEQFTINVKIGVKLREISDLLQKSEAPAAKKTLAQIELARALWETKKSPKTQKTP